MGCWHGEAFIYRPHPDPEAALGIEWCLQVPAPVAAVFPEHDQWQGLPAERLPPFDHSTHGAIVAWAPELPLLAVTKSHPHRIVVVDVEQQSLIYSCPSPDGQPYQAALPPGFVWRFALKLMRASCSGYRFVGFTPQNSSLYQNRAASRLRLAKQRYTG